MINVTHNEQFDCPQLQLGAWKIIYTGVDWNEHFGIGVLMECYKDESVVSLYSLLGFEMHSQQQGQCEIFYKGLQVYCEDMNDTCGGELQGDTILIVATTRQPLGLLCDDHPI